MGNVEKGAIDWEMISNPQTTDWEKIVTWKYTAVVDERELPNRLGEIGWVVTDYKKRDKAKYVLVDSRPEEDVIYYEPVWIHGKGVIPPQIATATNEGPVDMRIHK